MRVRACVRAWCDAQIAERFPPAKDPSLWRQLEDRYLQRLSAFLPTLLLEPLPPADLPK
jgi:hypothetical protein